MRKLSPVSTLIIEFPINKYTYLKTHETFKRTQSTLGEMTYVNNENGRPKENPRE